MFDGPVNMMKLARIAIEDDRDTFTTRFPYPVLVPSSVQRSKLSDTHEAGSTLYHLPAVDDAISLYSSPRILILRRSRQLGPGTTITVGRTTETDLTFSEHSVSKRHAAFVPVPGKPWKVEDLGSKNGTWIEDLRLLPGVPVEIESAQQVRFGRVRMHFFLPGDLYTMLNETTGGG